MDILAALDKISTPDRRCKLQRFLDGIPADTPNLTALHKAIADAESISAPQLSEVLADLGCEVSSSLINDHRREPKSCACR